MLMNMISRESYGTPISLIVVCLAIMLAPTRILAAGQWGKSAFNPVLQAGPSGAFDELHADAGKVLKWGDTYYLFYQGVDSNHNYRIGLATSTDLVNWTKYGVILDLGSSGAWDEQMVYDPRPIRVEDRWIMFYGGVSGLEWKIGIAESDDLFNWVKHTSNPVLEGTAGEFDAVGILNPSVVYQSAFKMWYVGRDSQGDKSIGLAISENGITWQKYAGNPVLVGGQSPEWDTSYIWAPYVVADQYGYRMWYDGADEDNVRRIGLATSTDGITWQKHSDNPVLDLGSEGEWDGNGVANPFFMRGQDREYLFYDGKSDNWEIGLAFRDVNIPQVLNVTAIQATDEDAFVHVDYDLFHDDMTPMSVGVRASDDNGVSWNSPIESVWGDVGENILPGTGKRIFWDARQDNPGISSASHQVRVIAWDNTQVSNGLLAYFPFENNADDESGNGNHGVISGSSIEFATGVVGNAIQFQNPQCGQAITGWVEFGDVFVDENLDDSSWSICMWILTLDDGQCNGRLFGSEFSIVLDYNAGATATAYASVGDGKIYTSHIGEPFNGQNQDAIITDGIWHHIALTMDRESGNLSLYFNGSLEYAILGEMYPPISFGNVILGASKVGDSYGARQTRVDNMRVYSRALSNLEILTLVTYSK
ncbi:MAG: family 43 glycosylhydrolase [bacterium]|nr:family 43 glycosylhydrolase [bacterium]